MRLGDIISPNHILLLDRPPDKPQLLRDLAERAAEALHLDAAELTAALLRREQLGSTGLGGGIAVPHTRIPGLPKPFGILAILGTPIAFDAIDEAPVDLVVLLLLPDNGEALKALATISRGLRQPELLAGLRHAETARAAYQALQAD